MALSPGAQKALRWGGLIVVVWVLVSLLRAPASAPAPGDTDIQLTTQAPAAHTSSARSPSPSPALAPGGALPTASTAKGSHKPVEVVPSSAELELEARKQTQQAQADADAEQARLAAAVAQAEQEEAARFAKVKAQEEKEAAERRRKEQENARKETEQRAAKARAEAEAQAAAAAAAEAKKKKQQQQQQQQQKQQQKQLQNQEAAKSGSKAAHTPAGDTLPDPPGIGSGSSSGGSGSGSSDEDIVEVDVRKNSLFDLPPREDSRIEAGEAVPDKAVEYCKDNPFDYDKCFDVWLRVLHSRARKRKLRGNRKKATLRNDVAVDETFNDGVMDCASFHIARVVGLPRAVPCVSISWTKDNLEEEYIPWFESREWGHKKIRDWFKNKHRGNKKLLFSKGSHMWLKRRLWLDGVSDRRRAKVPWDCGTYARVQVDKGWMSGCDRATFDTQPSELCVQQAGDVMNIMAFDYLIDNHDRPGNCFVMDKRLIALDQSNGNFKKHPTANRMQSPHLRIRPDIEARPTDTKQKPACTFECGMVERLWDLALDSTPLHVKVYKSMFRDPDANVTDSLQAEFLKKRTAMQVLDTRLKNLLAFVDRCIVKFGRDYTLFGHCHKLNQRGHKKIDGKFDHPHDPDRDTVEEGEEEEEEEEEEAEEEGEEEEEEDEEGSQTVESDDGGDGAGSDGAGSDTGDATEDSNEETDAI